MEAQSYCRSDTLYYRNTKYFYEQRFNIRDMFHYVFAGSLEAAYSLNWGAREIWGKGGGETLALL